MERIASLLPSITEIVCALGFGEALVARSHECDFPPEVARLPAVTQPKLDSGAPSRAIDDRVKQIVRDGLSVYRVDAERLRDLAPDVILTADAVGVVRRARKGTGAQHRCKHGRTRHPRHLSFHDYPLSGALRAARARTRASSIERADLAANACVNMPLFLRAALSAREPSKLRAALSLQAGP